MAAANVLTQFLKTVQGTLKPLGFERSKSTFWTRSGNNIGIIDVQRSVKSAVDRVIFTFNIGVWSDRIGRFGPGNAKSHPPVVDDCHWHERIGFLLPDREDKWWTISANDDPAVVTEQLSRVIVDVAVPALFTHVSDEALRDEWLTGRSPGLTEMQRLMYLTILLKEIGPDDALASAIAELKKTSEGKPIESIVVRHLQKLGLND